MRYEKTRTHLFRHRAHRRARTLFGVGVSQRALHRRRPRRRHRAIAALWIFADDIEGALDPNFGGSARFLTPENLKWAMVGAGGFVILLTVLHALSIYMQEIIVTEDKFLYRSGVGSTVNVMLPLSEIRYIDVRQNIVQLILGYGQIKIITDGEEPFVIKNLVRPERFARRIMRQCSDVRENIRPRLQLVPARKH